MKKYFFLTLLFTTVVYAQESPAQQIYSSPHEVLITTIKKGSTSGIMVGKMAEHLTRTFRSQGTLFFKSTVVKSFQQEGCKRIEIIYTKKEVKTPKGLTDAILKMQINYCLDGSAPREGGQ